METQLKFIFEQIGSVPPTVDKFFFEWIALAIRTDNNVLKRISQAVQGDDNFFQTDSPSRSNKWHFCLEQIAQAFQADDNFSEQIAQAAQMDDKIFFELIPRAIQTDTKSVQKWQNIFQA